MTVPEHWKPYALVPVTIITDQRLRPLERLLWCRLSAYGAKAWPKHATLAADLGVSDRSVRRWLMHLESLGYITRESRPGRTSRYSVDLPRTQACPTSPPHQPTPSTPDVLPTPDTSLSYTPDTSLSYTPDTSLSYTPDTSLSYTPDTSLSDDHYHSSGLASNPTSHYDANDVEASQARGRADGAPQERHEREVSQSGSLDEKSKNSLDGSCDDKQGHGQPGLLLKANYNSSRNLANGLTLDDRPVSYLDTPTTGKQRGALPAAGEIDWDAIAAQEGQSQVVSSLRPELQNPNEDLERKQMTKAEYEASIDIHDALHLTEADLDCDCEVCATYRKLPA